MKKNLKMNLICAIVFSMFLTVLTPGLTTFAEEQAEEQIDYSEYLVEDSTVSPEEAYLFDDNSYVEVEENNYLAIQPMLAPLVPIVIAVVVRLVTQWVGKKAVKTITKHAAERAAQRGISSSAFATAMAHGTKYVDKNTGAKILYHPGNKVALVLDNAGKTVVTTYKQNSPKSVWKKQNW
ncbi:hypothetical protein [Peribacillus sp. SI8-4]|uniref:hypothetical protein n=1 Tax=Peribacillus sp. SI8-4 TaxID=3048009 RepID=UPI0025525241|nr:hypothetical protein [Peribacillus sp. SI8-4]